LRGCGIRIQVLRRLHSCRSGTRLILGRYRRLVEPLRDGHARGDGCMTDLEMSTIVMRVVPLWPERFVFWSDLSCSPRHEIARGLR
jgi:hypothetical protein